MAFRRWTVALLALAVASVSLGVALAEDSGFHLRIRVVESKPEPYLDKEEANAVVSENSGPSNNDGDSDTDADADSSGDGDSEEPDADNGPDGVGDGYDIDWTNWNWPDDVTPDVWGDSIGPFGQCGGTGYEGGEICILDWVCVPLADSFSECLPPDWVAITDAPSTKTPTPTPTSTLPPSTEDPSSDSSGVDDTPTPTTEEPISDATGPGSSGADPVPSDSSTSSGPGSDEPSSDTPQPTTDSPLASYSPSSSPATDSPTTTEPPVPDVFQFDPIPAWLQCGGRNFNYYQYATGSLPLGDSMKLRCSNGYQCDVINEWFFQCLPIHDPNSLALWSQCGGEFHQGLAECVAGSYCKFFNQWYSQCVPAKKM